MRLFFLSLVLGLVSWSGYCQRSLSAQEIAELTRLLSQLETISQAQATQLAELKTQLAQAQDESMRLKTDLAQAQALSMSLSAQLDQLKKSYDEQETSLRQKIDELIFQRNLIFGTAGGLAIVVVFCLVSR
jgi:septal ring factor EnvC (AmiA/AmiB activator)